MKSISFRTLAAAAALCAGSLSAHAATLNFAGLPFNSPDPLVLSNATLINNTGNAIFVGAGAAGEADGFCFASLGGSCEADGEILFTLGPVTNLTFDADGFNPGDFTAITAFNGAVAVGTINATANGSLNFSAFGAITRLVFNDSSTAAGFGWSTFNFTQGSTGMPEPGTLALVGLALLGAATARRRAG